MMNEMKGPYFIICGYTDLRRGIDGLAGIVQQNYKLDVCSGGLFLFCLTTEDFSDQETKWRQSK